MADEIDGAVRVFRFVKEDDVMPTENGERPKSSCFSDHREDGAMSVFLEDEIVAEGRKPEELYEIWPGYRVCYHTVAEYRELGQIIRRKKIADFPGHANVTDRTGKRSAGRKTRLAKTARWLDRDDVTD